MMIRIIFLMLAVTTVLAQPPKRETREFTGIVKSYRVGFGFAYERVIIDVTGTEEQFVFFPRYGKLMTDNFKVGDRLTLRASVSDELNERIKKMSEAVQKSFRRDIILAVKIDDQWTEMPQVMEPDNSSTIFGCFLDIEVKDEYIEGGHQIGLIFNNGIVAYNWFQQINRIRIGDKISFGGHPFASGDGFVYPVPGVKAVYIFRPYTKTEGVIKSMLFKQNYVCIGMVVKTKKGEVKMGFPSNYAERIQRLAARNEKLTFYFEFFDRENALNPPDLQIIVSDTDTLKVGEQRFYGGADIKHDHKPATIKGKITDINRSDKGKVISIIVGTDCYVDVDPNMEKQLGHFFKRGQLIELSGNERIKVQGEVYSKEYRIITPHAVTIDGKNFLLRPQP